LAALGGVTLADDLGDLKQRAERGDVKAMVELGGRYARAPVPDYAQAFQWLRRAADLGDAGAMFSVAVMYRAGAGVAMDKAESLVWLNRAAQAGNLNAINTLGRIYALGEGVPQNAATALKWFHLAADKGDTGAMMKIADIYFNGRGGTPVDYAETVKWIRMAVDRGNADAMAYLSTLYHDGLGVERDDLKAYEWASKAVDAGNLRAKELRDLLKQGLNVSLDKPSTATCASIKAKLDPDGTITQENFKQLMISMGYKWNPAAETGFQIECKGAAKGMPITKHQQLWPTSIIFSAKVVDDKGVCRLTDVSLEPCE
jgi:TPR repeat protein